jgi:hypothetical protein
MTKINFAFRGPSKTAKERTYTKEDAKKLRLRAEALKLKAASLAHEADELLERAQQIEAADRD